MYKLILIVTMAVLTMAFVQPDKNKSTDTEKNSSALLAQKGNKGNNGGSKKQGDSHQSKSNGEQSKAKQNKLSGNKSYGGNGNQGGKSHQNKQLNSGKQNKGNFGNEKYNNNKQGNNYQGKNQKKNHNKGQPNKGYVYVNKHGYFSPSNYGHYRSQQARNKHKLYHPYYEYEAIEGFNLIISRNGFLYTETNFKINLINVRLAERRRANLITVVQYDMYAARILYLQQRRAALEINISL